MGKLLSGLPQELEDELFDKFKEIERNYREQRWEPAELNGGKFSEVAYCILKGHVDGSFPNKATKPQNFLQACQQLEQLDQKFGRSVRIQIPRILVALYEIRNNRNVGHVGGEVDPNQMDASCVVQMAKWVLAELVRIFHSVSTAEATMIVNSIVERMIPLIWQVGEVKRVLNNKLSMLEKTLVLLYGSSSPVLEAELVRHLEHSNPSVYRRDILRVAHKSRLLEYTEKTKPIFLSPLGIRHVEDKILL